MKFAYDMTPIDPASDTISSESQGVDDYGDEGAAAARLADTSYACIEEQVQTATTFHHRPPLLLADGVTQQQSPSAPFSPPPPSVRPVATTGNTTETILDISKASTKSTDQENDDDVEDDFLENGVDPSPLPLTLYDQQGRNNPNGGTQYNNSLRTACRTRRLVLVGITILVLGVAIIAAVVISKNRSAANSQQQEGHNTNIFGDELTTPEPTERPTLSQTSPPTTAPTGGPATPPIVLTHQDITGEGSGDMQLSVSQITFGKHHHLFGYIGQSLTIPWNGNERYIVALESDFHDHLPRAHEAARIILIDTLNDAYSIQVLDETRAWNLQQGTMLYWNPHSVDTQFFFNDRDVETNKVFTVLYDIVLRKRVREYRFSDDMPVANGGVCPNGGFFYAINYARMARLRPVTGYPDTFDWTIGERAPANDGVWKVDIESGEKELLVSFEDIDTLLAEDEDNPEEADLYINHALSSRDCSRIYFFGRGRLERKDQAINQPFVMNSDGSELRSVKYIGGHPEWFNETILFGKRGKSVVMFDVESDSVQSELGRFDDPRGDLSLSADGKMFVNGWEDDDSLRYHFVRLTDGAEVTSMPMNRGPHTDGDLRIDAAPRWNRRGNKVLIPGWVDGVRQLHVLTTIHGDNNDIIGNGL